MTAEAGPAQRRGVPPVARTGAQPLALSFLRRLVQAAALIATVLLLNFLLIRLAPGDPALAIAGGMGGATQEIVEDIRRDHGLDRPLHSQLLTYAALVASGDLGHSLYFDTAVLDLVLARLGPTLLLAVTALLAAAVLGSVLGVHAARRPHGTFAKLAGLFTLAVWSAPTVLGVSLIGDGVTDDLDPRSARR